MLPEVSLTVETKIANDKHGKKEIGEELIIDTRKYSSHPKCDILVCLVFDPDFVIGNKFGFIGDLERDKNLKVKAFVIR